MWFSRRKYQHEIFLSHAVEDKAAIADELRTRLKAEGLKVWYSGDELIVGGGIHDDIEEAIDQSRFGVAVFTKTFINSDWTKRELNWLEKKEKGNVNVILPVLHEMTVEELAAFNPRMATKFCIEAHRGIDYVIRKIHDEVLNERVRIVKARKKTIAWVSFAAFIFMMLAGYVSYSIITHRPTCEQIEATIDERLRTCINTIESRYASQLRADGIAMSQAQLDSVRNAYDNFKSYYRNEYEFNNCYTTVRSRTNVQAVIGRDVVDMANQPGYGMDSVDIYWANKVMTDGFRHSGFILVNKRNVEYTWEGRSEGAAYVVDVTYTNEIRYIDVSLTFPPTLSGMRRHEMSLLGFAPSESYYFEEGADGEWYFKKVE